METYQQKVRNILLYWHRRSAAAAAAVRCAVD